jgi:hypothetical protein
LKLHITLEAPRLLFLSFTILDPLNGPALKVWQALSFRDEQTKLREMKKLAGGQCISNYNLDCVCVVNLKKFFLTVKPCPDTCKTFLSEM